MTKELVELSRATPANPLPGWGPSEYTNWMDEQMSWKRTCYIGDWSFLPALKVEGPDALKLFSDFTVNTFERFDIGQAKHAIQCNQDGKVISEGILLRLAEAEFCIESLPALYFGYRAAEGKYDVKVTYVDWFFYQIQGPNALELVEKLTGESLRDVKFMRFKQASVGGHQVLALRQGMSGELGGFELQGPAGAAAADVRNLVLNLGKEVGIRQLGSRSAMINHLEAWYPTVNQHYLPAVFGDEMSKFRDYMRSSTPVSQGLPESRLIYLSRHAAPRNVSGSYEAKDISEYYRTPVELGWRKNIKFDHQFLGRAALEAEIAHPKRVGVTLEFNPDDIVSVYASFFKEGEHYDFMDFPHNQRSAMHASKILKSEKLVGCSTMPAYSYQFRKMLSISCVDVNCAGDGEDVGVIWGEPGHLQLPLRAKVRSAPYKKDNRRGALPA